jgi:hypothetical protein
LDFAAQRHRSVEVYQATIGGVIDELYDILALPGVRRPMALGFKSDEIRRVITIGVAS